MKNLSVEKMEKVNGGNDGLEFFDCVTTLIDLDPNYSIFGAILTCAAAFDNPVTN